MARCLAVIHLYWYLLSDFGRTIVMRHPIPPTYVVPGTPGHHLLAPPNPPNFVPPLDSVRTACTFVCSAFLKTRPFLTLFLVTYRFGLTRQGYTPPPTTHPMQVSGGKDSGHRQPFCGGYILKGLRPAKRPTSYDRYAVSRNVDYPGQCTVNAAVPSR